MPEVTEAEYKSEFEHTKDTPNLALTGEHSILIARYI